MELIPANIGQEARYTLNRLPVYDKVDRDKQPFMLMFTPTGNLAHREEEMGVSILTHPPLPQPSSS